MSVRDDIMRLCESPLESIFAGHLIRSIESVKLDQLKISAERVSIDALPPADSGGITIYLQATVGKYRTDFLFDCRNEGKRRLVVVEIDGHDYHERTKDQAYRDKRRDRYFVGLGIDVLRFTGSEVFANPDAIGGEVFEHIARRRPA